MPHRKLQPPLPKPELIPTGFGIDHPIGETIPHTPRLLVVEDDLTTCHALSVMFRRRGWEVQTVQTVAGAKQLLLNGWTHVIVDLVLPDGKGCEILRAIRDSGSGMKVIVTTGSKDPAIAIERAGFKPDVILEKPMKVDDLLKAMS